MIDMSENRVPYGLLSPEERASFPNTAFILIYCDNEWIRCACNGYHNDRIYRTIKEPVRKSSRIGFHYSDTLGAHGAHDAQWPSDSTYYEISFDTIDGIIDGKSLKLNPNSDF